MNFGTGEGNVGIYSIRGGNATNSGTITVGASNPSSNLYSIGMQLDTEQQILEI